MVSDLVWRNLPTNITDGVLIVRLRDTLLQPAQPADTATAGAWKAYEARIKKVITFAAASELLTQSLKDVIPQSDRDLLSDPILGLVQYSSLQIMDHLRTQYGVFRATDFLQLISQLEQKVSPSADFSDVASKHRLIFSQFATNGQPISEPQQCQYLSNTIASQPHLVKARDLYFQQQPETRLQTFAALLTYITTHAPNIIATAGTGGYSAQATIVPADVPREFTPAAIYTCGKMVGSTLLA